MKAVSEFCGDAVTASMNFPLPSGEHYGKPVSVGTYHGSAEVWIEGDCGRINIPIEHLETFIKQLRRAGKCCNDIN